MKTNRLVYITLILLVMVGCSKAKDFVYTEPTGVTLVLGTENRQGLARGWNDITALVIDKGQGIEIVSIPRDSLVDIPTKGKWTLNSLYLVYGIKGLTNWISEHWKIDVDNYVVYELKNGEKLHKLLGIDTKYSYDQAWIRHRHKLNDYKRQIRIQSFVDQKVLPKLSNLPNLMVRTTVGLGLSIAKECNIYSNVGANLMRNIVYAHNNKKIAYTIADGRYQRTYFELVKNNGYCFLKGWTTTFKLTTDMTGTLVRNSSKFYNENYVYSIHDILSNRQLDIITPYDSKDDVYYTNWNGGLLYTGR